MDTLFTLIVYLGLMFSCIILSRSLVRGSNQVIFYDTKSQKRIIIWIIVIYLVIVGLRWSVGVDWDNYYNWFAILEKTGNFAVEDPDIGYYYLNLSASLLGLGFYFILLTITFITIYSILGAGSYYREIFPFFFFFFFCIIFNESLNVMRQILAFWVIFFGITLYFRNRFKYACIAFLIAWLFHKTALIAMAYIPFLFIKKMPNKYIAIVMIIVSFLMGNIFYEYIKEYMTAFEMLGDSSRFTSEMTEYGFRVFENQARDWSTETAKYAYLVLDIIICLNCTKMKRIWKDRNFVFFYYLFLIGEILQPIFIANALFERVNYYFYLYKILILSLFCYYLWSLSPAKKMFWKRTTVAGIVSLYLFLHIKHIIQSDSIVPYQNVILNLISI